MSVDLMSFVEVKNKNTRKWEEFKCEEPFSYNAREFFATWFNRHNLPTAPWAGRGWPKDSDWMNMPAEDNPEYEYCWPDEKVIDYLDNDNNNSRSYCTLKELSDFDYEQTFEDLYDYEHLNGRNPMLEPGNGHISTIRNNLGDLFFASIHELVQSTKDITDGNQDHVRIIYALS